MMTFRNHPIEMSEDLFEALIDWRLATSPENYQGSMDPRGAAASDSRCYDVPNEFLRSIGHPYTDTVAVTVGNHEEALKAIATLNKRASKLGVPAIQVREVERFEERVLLRQITEADEVWGPEAIRECYGVVRFIRLHIHGESPKLNGWRLAGVIEHKDKSNVFRAVPGESIPEEFRANARICQHCNLSRRRLDTVVVVHDDGTYKQVGKNCLADFLGGINPDALLKAFDHLTKLISRLGEYDEDGGFGGAGGTRVPTEIGIVGFLAHTAAFVRRYGFMSATKYRELTNGDYDHDVAPPTSGRAWGNIMLMLRPRKGEHPETVEQRDVEMAQAALAWVRGVDQDWFLGNDYRSNLYYLCLNDGIEYRDKGLAASLVSCYQRHLDDVAAKEREASTPVETVAKAASVALGSVGERVEGTFTVEEMRPFESQFGVSTMTKMVDERGNRAVWWASNTYCVEHPGSKRLVEMEKGETYRLKGTVKKVGDFRGQVETTLTRCKVLEWVRTETDQGADIAPDAGTETVQTRGLLAVA